MERQYSAGGIVINKNKGIRVLLVKNKYGRWTWPKGHIEKGESREDAALREIREETGLENLKIIRTAGSQEYWFTLKGGKIFKTVYLFLVESEDENLCIQKEEILSAEWLSPEQAVTRIEYDGSREILEKALEI